MKGITVIFTPQGNSIRIQLDALRHFQNNNDLVVLLALLAGAGLDERQRLVNCTSIQQIAALIGVHRQSVAGTLGRLKQAGWFQVENAPGRQTLYCLNAGPQDDSAAFIHFCTGDES